MKHVKLTLQIIMYSFVFLLFLNISDASPYKFPAKKQDCRSYLVQMNQTLQQDPDGILDENEVTEYEQCVASIEEMDLDNVSNFILLLNCYTNLMDYYEYVAEDDDTAMQYEDKIYAITE